MSSNVTLWERVKKQKHGIGNMALLASTFLLALRLIEQDKEIQQLKDGESSLLQSLRQENRSVQQKFANFRAAVAEEIVRVGNRLPPLSTRLQTLLEEGNSRETLPSLDHDEQAGQGVEPLQLQAKEKSNFMV